MLEYGGGKPTFLFNLSFFGLQKYFGVTTDDQKLVEKEEKKKNNIDIQGVQQKTILSTNISGNRGCFCGTPCSSSCMHYFILRKVLDYLEGLID